MEPKRLYALSDDLFVTRSIGREVELARLDDPVIVEWRRKSEALDKVKRILLDARFSSTLTGHFVIEYLLSAIDSAQSEEGKGKV